VAITGNTTAWTARAISGLERHMVVAPPACFALVFLDQSVDFARRFLLLHGIDFGRIFCRPIEERFATASLVGALDAASHLVEHTHELGRDVAPHSVVGLGLALTTRVSDFSNRFSPLEAWALTGRSLQFVERAFLVDFALARGNDFGSLGSGPLSPSAARGAQFFARCSALEPNAIDGFAPGRARRLEQHSELGQAMHDLGTAFVLNFALEALSIETCSHRGIPINWSGSAAS